MSVLKQVGLVAIFMVSCAQQVEAQKIKKFLNNAGSLVGGKTKGTTGITNTEITAGLREALQVGAKNATGKLSLANGFLGNALVKVFLPPEAKKVENTLRSIGMGNYVDKAIVSMNRAAEDASIKALPIFTNAINGMTIQDALSILNGNEDAATQYLKSKTAQQLTDAFRPIIAQSLEKVNATKYWTEVFETYNALPTTFNKVNPDLTAYVTEKALAGVFITIAEEERKIRVDPAARISDILKKVFAKP